MNEPAWEEQWPEITDARLRAVLRVVPRVRFVPEELQPWSLRDEPLPIGEGQTISQPFIVAWMTQALALQPGERTLEIGTGSGYQTAILNELTRQANEPPGLHVYSIERFSTLAKRAAQVLHELGHQPHLREGDGALGWPEAAPFAAIIVTAAPAYLPKALWDQLAEGGRMVVPIGATPADQRLWLIRKVAGQPALRNLGNVRFVPFVSPSLDDPQQRIEL